jgi:hypothetical protein
MIDLTPQFKNAGATRWVTLFPLPLGGGGQGHSRQAKDINN